MNAMPLLRCNPGMLRDQSRRAKQRRDVPWLTVSHCSCCSHLADRHLIQFQARDLLLMLVPAAPAAAAACCCSCYCFCYFPCVCHYLFLLPPPASALSPPSTAATTKMTMIMSATTPRGYGRGDGDDEGHSETRVILLRVCLGTQALYVLLSDSTYAPEIC